MSTTIRPEISKKNRYWIDNGNYIEAEVLLVNPDDLLSILERVVALEKAVYEN